MPEVKKHIKELYRTHPAESVRDGSLRLDMNEGVHGLPGSFVRRALKKITPESLLTYPSHAALIARIASHNGLRPENICLGNGSDGVIKYIYETYISPGDKVLMTNPTFAMYPVYCKMFGASPVIIDYSSGLKFPLKEFLGRLKKGIKMAVVVNPNNPIGDVLSPRDLRAIIEKASRNGILMVVDEAYFYYYPKSVIELVRKYKNLIVIRTFSKLCALAAVRVGYAAASPDIVQDLKKVKLSFDVDSIAVLFACELLDNPGVIADMIERAREGAQHLSKRLTAAGIRHIAGNANFMLIECGGSVGDILKKLQLRGILVSGNFKQPFLKDYLRVTIGDKARMERFWKEFSKIAEISA